MNPIKSAMRRLVKILVLVVVLIGGVVFGLYKMRVDIPALNTSKIYAHLDSMGMRANQIKGYVVGQYESHFGKHKEEAHHEHQKIVVTSPMVKDVIITRPYVCQIRSQRHIDVCALENGYLKAIPIKEGQVVKTGELLFEIVTILYKARLDAELAERDLARLEWQNTKRLFERQGVSENEVKLFEAKLAKAQAKADLALAELNFATVRAPFDGIVDRLHEQQGSLVKEGDMLTTLSDNSVMWVYFNVPERRYLEYMAELGQNDQEDQQVSMEGLLAELNKLVHIELGLANGSKFSHPGKIAAIEANFNNENGNIAFRADVSNPNRLLRHGQTGTVLISRALKNAIVIPQRATYEILDKQYVYVVGKDGKAHQRAIVVQHEKDDIFVIEKGLDANDKIVLEGVRQVHDGEPVEFEFRKPEEALKNQKYHAE